MSDITITELEELCRKAFEKRAEIDELDNKMSGLTKELEDLKQTLLNHLTEHNKTSYASAFGKIEARSTFTVPTPKSPESRQQFFDYLKSKGLFDDMISVNSKTLNAYYKQEVEQAQATGNLNFRIPGLDEPYYKETIAFKRK